MSQCLSTKAGQVQNAVIQEMRYDPLTKHEEAKVSLIEGDFYALLGGESERTTFAVDIPEAQARIESGDFWVQSGDAGAKFTNYDDRPVAVATSSENIVLGRNEGLVLSTEGEAAEKRGVLDAPSLSAPPNDGIVYNASLELAWADPSGAEAYWLEIAADQAFDAMLVSEFGIAEPAFRPAGLPPGEYYWRVSALDAFGLPGQRSAPWRFTVASDNAPPFLRIDAPVEGTIVRDASIEIQGETEPGAIVKVNGRPAEVTAEGRFVGPNDSQRGRQSRRSCRCRPCRQRHPACARVQPHAGPRGRGHARCLDPARCRRPDSGRRRCGFPRRQHQARLSASMSSAPTVTRGARRQATRPAASPSMPSLQRTRNRCRSS